jgi:hypothetical protein
MANSNSQIVLILVVLAFVGVFLFALNKPCGCKEGYRDPLYLNRAKYSYDYYPRANGTIYGFPYRYGGSWSIFSGFPWYDKAY